MRRVIAFIGGLIFGIVVGMFFDMVQLGIVIGLVLGALGAIFPWLGNGNGGGSDPMPPLDTPGPGI